MSFTRVASFTSNDSGYETASSQDSLPRSIFKHQDNTKEIARRQQHALAERLNQRDAEDYQDDMLEHMLRMDGETLPDVDSIDIQTEIQWFMRPYLLDFLVEAHSAFQLLPETLFLTINLLDRYCSKRVVYKRHYQLVGCAALLIASKYGDKKEKVPTIKELKSMCCSLYDDDMFLQMEWHVLSTLGWAVGHPTVDSFLKMAIKDQAPDQEVEHLSLYILEIALYHRDFVSKRSVNLTSASLALARELLRRQHTTSPMWATAFEDSIYHDLLQKIHNPSTILRRKYASARYSCVAKSLETILAQRLAQAQMPITPTYELTPPSTTRPQAGNTYFTSYGTPQKPSVPSIVQHGLYTPPITPGEEMFGVTQKTFGSGPTQYAPPTPSSHAQQYQQYQYQPQSVAPGHRWTVETY